MNITKLLTTSVAIALGLGQAFAGSPAIFNGDFAKMLKTNINLFDQAYIYSGALNPSSVATLGPAGSIYMSSNGNVYVKQDGGTTTNWTALGGGGGGGDVSNGGNSYGSGMTLGTTDSFGLNLLTSNTPRLFITDAGIVTVGLAAASFAPAQPGSFGADYVSPMLDGGFDLGNMFTSSYVAPANYGSDIVGTAFVTSVDASTFDVTGGVSTILANASLDGSGDYTSTVQNISSDLEAGMTGQANAIIGVSSRIALGGGSGEVVSAYGFSAQEVQAQGTSGATAANHMAAGLRVNGINASGATSSNISAGIHIPTGAITASGPGAFAYSILSEDTNPASFAGPVWAPLLSLNGIGISQAPQSFLSFSSGTLVAATANQILGMGLATRAQTVENISGIATALTCSVDPSITLLDCGTSPTDCTTGNVILAQLTFTAANTVTTNTVSVPDILAGHYWAFMITNGTCTALSVTGSAGARMQ